MCCRNHRQKQSLFWCGQWTTLRFSMDSTYKSEDSLKDRCIENENDFAQCAVFFKEPPATKFRQLSLHDPSPSGRTKSLAACWSERRLATS
mmetsp:Transcript_10115/g.23404  ORF Transcript_10115/g.23404 Transcript_10115/m.23404 type:complete len:91 (+) Transcript_10115:796-1068(+)